MKRILLLLLLLILAAAITLTACNKDGQGDVNDGGTTDGGTTDDTDNGDKPGGDDTEGDGIDWDNTGLDGLPLIYDGKARFQVVYTSEGGASAIKAANNLVERLRELGVEIGDAVSDKDAAAVKEYEVIIGSGARNRGDDVAISARKLGENGEIVKLFGTKLLIAAGTSAKTKTLCESYVSFTWGIKSNTKELKQLAIDPSYVHEKKTEYYIESITVAGTDLGEYTLITDLGDAVLYDVKSIKSFVSDLYDVSGYWLEAGESELADTYPHKVIIRYNPTLDEKYREDGFAAYVDASGDLIVECSYANAFANSFYKFANKYFYSKDGKVKLESGFEYTDVASRVYYSDFGAKGDGATDDYMAIYDAHVYANQCGQTVYGTPGKTYYVHVFHNGEIPVKTDVVLTGSKFIINDTGSTVYAQRGGALFKLQKDNPIVTYTEQQIDSMFPGVSLKVGDTAIPWLADYLVAESMIRFTNSYHKDYVRNGGNLDSGYNRTDAIVVDTNGNIDPATPLVFDFERITEIRIIRTDDKPITFDGCEFVTICCRAVAETNFENKYHAYGRGISVLRANSTVKNVTHRMDAEPELNVADYGRYGKQDESYPYHAFLVYDQTYNSVAQDMDLTGHTTYYESKGTSDTPVAMGSYDFVLGYGIGIKFIGVKQYGVEITDERYWGIMASNGVKNIEFTDCYISRFDAHRGFWNGTLTNVTLGHSFNVIGGGDLRATNVTKITGYWFVHLRGDYGATFEGDMYFKDCELKGYGAYNSNNGGSYSQSVKYSDGQLINSGYSAGDPEYLGWDFGYTCYMPKTITLDNFKSGIPKVYVYNNILDMAFDESTPNRYMITTQITYRNMHSLATVANENTCPTLSKVPVVNETYPEESTASEN